MSNPSDTHKMIGESILGVDTFSPEDGIFYWGRPNYINKKIFTKNNNSSFINTVPIEMKISRLTGFALKINFLLKLFDLKTFPHPCEFYAIETIIKNLSLLLQV